jgi:hypothetical protein
MKEIKQFRCYFTNEYHNVTNILTEREYNSLPTYVKGDYKPYKQK